MTGPHRFVSLLCAACLAPSALLAQPASAGVAERTTEVRRYLDEQRKQRGFPGACAAWVLPDGTCEAVAVGVSDRDLGRPMSTRDRLLSGSIGKTYVATVVLQLVVEKKLGLDDPVRKHLGELSWYDRLPNAAHLTVRSLLNHTSGIREHVYDPKFHAAIRAAPDREWKPAELLAYALDQEPLFAVGEGWSYADTNYVVLGVLIETVTGQPFRRALHARVLHEFDLKDTMPSDRRCIPGLAQGYSGMGAAFGVGGRTLVNGVFRVNPQFEWCGGGLACTAADLARWSRICGAGRHWPAALRDEIRAGVAAPRLGRGARYGLGVILEQTPHGESVGHSGFMPGYNSAMRYYTGLDCAVAIQFNTDHRRELGRSPGAYLDAIAGLLGLPARRPGETGK